MRIGVLRVTPELLAELLHLPEGHSIRNARLADDWSTLELLVEGPEMPEHRGGETPTRVDLVCTVALGDPEPKRIITSKFARR